MEILILSDVVSNIKTIMEKNPGPVKRIGIFGSLVRGQATEESDIDIAIEYEPSEKFDFERFIRFCELCEKLRKETECIYNRKIDVVHVEDKKGSFFDEIKKEIIWI